MGPTASGKTALALAAARALGDVELVSVDSMGVYRGMDVGTAKPTVAERADVPCHLLDLADPSEDFSLARFTAVAAEAVAGIEARGRRALLVGGTALYLQAVVDGLALPGRWPHVRAALEAEAVTPAGVAALHRQLASADPAAAARMEPSNARRIVRALEVTIGSGRPFSSFGPGLGDYPPSRFSMVGVWLPRPVVAERIAGRYVDQLADGFVPEVTALAARPDGLSRTAAQALGYRELLDHVGGRYTLDEAVAAAVARTRRFARRQRAWFRRDPRITWLAAARNPAAVLPALLGHWMP
ncbi:MAG: tRNA (adenosine(37)-N6)-dimethylallyltransferase MiaA [Acidimicrobiales bacterium]